MKKYLKNHFCHHANSCHASLDVPLSRRTFVIHLEKGENGGGYKTTPSSLQKCIRFC